MRAYWAGAAVVVGLSGCGAASEGHAVPTEVPVRVPVAAHPAPYEVHEWGLMRGGPGDSLDVGAVAPPTRVPMYEVDKPILYFHAAAPVSLASVSVEAIGGAIREHWPLTTEARAPSAITWRGFHIEPGNVVGQSRCAAGHFPAANARPCSDLAPGERCESTSLAGLVTADASCLEVGADGAVAGEPFLFYRSRTQTFTPPLSVRVTRVPGRAAGEIAITNNGDLPIPGWLVRLRHDGGVQTLAVRPPAPHETIVIPTDFAGAVNDVVPRDHDSKAVAGDKSADRPAGPGGPEAGRRALLATLSELGLTGAEAEAFARAWDAALFGGGEIDGDRVRDGKPGADDERVVGSVDSLLYFLPEPTCDQVARLTFDPPPTAVRRALAVWVRF